jgi:phosphomannomutase
VRADGCDLGVAFDGDGDRIGLVDGTGEPLLSDHALLFLARDLLARRPGATVVGDVKSSRLLFDGVRAAGGRAVMAPSGYVLVREVMLRERAALGGELSGHVFFADWRTTDDALYAALQVLAALSRSGASLADFRKGLPACCATPELRIACPDAAAAVARVAERLGLGELDPAMGVRRELEEGWWLIRASGTEPKITVRCEATTAVGLARLEASLQAHLKACGVG